MEACSLSSKNDDDFLTWLDGIVATYKSLNIDNKNTLLDSLIANSEPCQLSFLSARLPDWMCHNFISILPAELVSVILNYLDIEDILKCCQVCKGWKRCIDSLTDLWRDKAHRLGVNVQAVSLVRNGDPLSTEISRKAKMFKTIYCRAEIFLSGLKKGNQCIKMVTDVVQTGLNITDICLSDKYLFTGHHLSALCDGIQDLVQMWSLPDLQLEQTISMTRNCKILSYNNSQLFMFNFNATVEGWSVDSGNKLHTFVGHTSVVVTIDVTADKDFVLTGSMDRSVKVWDMRCGSSHAELFMTLDNAHVSRVKKVRFLPFGDNGELRFISFDKNSLISWSLDVKTRVINSSQMDALDEGLELFSCYLDLAKPDTDTVFISQWDFKAKQSWLVSYQLHRDTRIELNQSWYLNMSGVKADILGVGRRFALLMCSISCQDFHLFDFTTESCLVTIATPNFTFRLMGSTSNIRLCDTSWLDGFVFDQMHHGANVFEAVDTKNQVVIGTWNVPELDGRVDDSD